MANCLQFQKEVSLHPGNSGTIRTRAMVCELLAIRLLKEYTARELIDALSYDFDPFQGQAPTIDAPGVNGHTGNSPAWTAQRHQPRAARISCLEIAIRAQSKRFLAHPLVVQQLEAIWAGSIVFHSAADNMHRPAFAKQSEQLFKSGMSFRRTVTLYDPRDASLFKLSRLRVPRYRNLLSTASFAILLGLFLAVLVRQSFEITGLEVVFWFWTAGYMLDEIVGFNEQGFSLYIASFWNTFDLGILLILILHLCLRLYSVIIPDERRHHVANLAYDILAADAVLLFPRLFSVLDHYRYFSQLLIAFRMMASDLMAIFVLIIISCSGFFVALTLGFGNDRIDTPGSVAYALLQILMGFTPAAWDRWSGYNALGKTILTLFLFICHFLVVTILITVLTNSFMAIVQNANEEHQFVFAVNTISMVKSDALFSYVAPTNVIAWVLTPLRAVVPFRRYVKLNRTVIKITHFPILFLIFAYEKTILRSSAVDAIELIKPRGRANDESANKKSQRLLREPSVATFRQERALEEVFRRPYEGTIHTTQKSQERRKTSNVINNWMRNMDTGAISPPPEQDRSLVERLEKRQSVRRRSRLPTGGRDFSAARSAVSDPEEFRGNLDFLSSGPRKVGTNETTPSFVEDTVQQTDADGDDELVTNDNNDEDKMTLDPRRSVADVPETTLVSRNVPQADYFARRSRPHKPKTKTPEMSTSLNSSNQVNILPRLDEQPGAGRASPLRGSPKHRPNAHLRNVSTATILYNPVQDLIDAEVPLQSSRRGSATGSASGGAISAVLDSGAQTPASKPVSAATGRRTPKKLVPGARARPLMPPKEHSGFQSAPNLAGLVMINNRNRPGERPKSQLMDLGSDIGDNKAIGGGFVGALPASLGTQMAYASGALRGYPREAEDQDRDRFGRLMLARMNTLEEGFREVVHEMRSSLRHDASRAQSRARRGRAERPQPKRRQSQQEASKENSAGLPVGDNHKAEVQQGQSPSTKPQAGDDWIDEEEGHSPVKGGSS